VNAARLELDSWILRCMSPEINAGKILEDFRTFLPVLAIN
jgi:hypothetical protein